MNKDKSDLFKILSNLKERNEKLSKDTKFVLFWAILVIIVGPTLVIATEIFSLIFSETVYNFIAIPTVWIAFGVTFLISSFFGIINKIKPYAVLWLIIFLIICVVEVTIAFIK